jgi:hypothetical protein
VEGSSRSNWPSSACAPSSGRSTRRHGGARQHLRRSKRLLLLQVIRVHLGAAYIGRRWAKFGDDFAQAASKRPVSLYHMRNRIFEYLTLLATSRSTVERGSPQGQV